VTRRDPLLEALAQRLREEDDLADARWDALPSGKLSAEDEAALAALAARGEAPRDAYEAFRPMTAEEKGALADGAFAEIARRKARIVAAPAHVPERPAVATAKSVGTIARRPPRRALYALTVAASLAAAAAFGLLYRPASAPIAAYMAFVEEGHSQERPYVRPGDAPSTEAVSLRGDARVHLMLRPETAVAGPLTVRSYLVVNGVVRPWTVPVEVGPNGTLRIAGLHRSMFEAVADGACDLVVVIGRRDTFPTEDRVRERIAARERSGGPEGLRIVALPLILGPP
jgi:hypothetical protein